MKPQNLMDKNERTVKHNRLKVTLNLKINICYIKKIDT